VGEEQAQANLKTAIYAALAAAGLDASAVTGVCAGMAGVDRPHERAVVAQWLDALLPGAPALIENDAMIALASGTEGMLFGVVAISGTGMIVYGVDSAGQRRRAGGWGALLDEHGSGYAMGVAALRAVAQAVDGTRPATRLQPAILSHLGLQRPQDLINWTYRDLTWARFADLAPIVMQCAETGDESARHILSQTAQGLGEAIVAVVTGLALQEAPFPLILTGGNLREGPLHKLLSQRVRIIAPQAQIIHPVVDPAIGAAWLALRNPPGASEK
jgi:N-acetylglucosamine kinase-like BadF-type ATPase